MPVSTFSQITKHCVTMSLPRLERGEGGYSVSVAHFFGRRAKIFYGDMVAPCLVIFDNDEVVVIARDEKRAPPIVV